MLKQLLFLTIIFSIPSFGIAQSNLGIKKMSHNENKLWFEPVPKLTKKIIGYRSVLRNGDTIKNKSLELIYDRNGNLIEKKDFLSYFLMKYEYDTLNRRMSSKIFGLFEDEIPNKISTYSYPSNDTITKNTGILSDTILIERNEYNKKGKLMCSKIYHSEEKNSNMIFLTSYEYNQENYSTKSLHYRMPTRELIFKTQTKYGEYVGVAKNITIRRGDFSTNEQSPKEKTEYTFYKEGINKGKIQSIRIIPENRLANNRIYEEEYSYTENEILASFKQNGTQIYKYQFIYDNEKLIRVNYYSIIDIDKIDKWLEYEYIFY